MNPRALSVRAAAREAPGEPALCGPGEEVRTWAELAAEAEAHAGAMRASGRGGGQGAAATPVEIEATNRPETVTRILAALETERPFVLLHPRWTAAERAERRAAVEAPATGAAILFTSGSGGRPRAVELSRDALAAAARASAARLGWRTDDRWLCALPLAHVGGLSILVRCLAARRPVVLVERFRPAEAAGALERHRATLASLVPTMLADLLDALPGWRPPPWLRAVLLGGAAAPERLWDEGLARGLPLLETYGSTEACSQVATAVPGGPPRDLRPLEGVEVRVRDGRIEVRSPALLTRYLPPGAHPSPFTDDGWLRTGDAGRLRGDGTLDVLGRADDVIVTGGEKVTPAEVEAALAALPGVRRAVVVGLPDPRWGEIVAAALERGPGSGAGGDTGAGGDPLPARAVEAPADLRAALESRLAPFRRPRRVLWMDAIPLTPSGKPDRAAVARELEAWGQGV
ncbi:MAG: fatty acid--CoA ligase family protein [Gemmatimonadota bacterium]|nr:fatty acid--CoA ligase family protein [Gemmatimonadota bacterium]